MAETPKKARGAKRKAKKNEDPEEILPRRPSEEVVAAHLRAVEDRPHASFLKYLLTKRYAPAAVRMECWRLGLSTPSEESLRTYYLQILDPLIGAHGVKALYTPYHRAITGTTNGRYPVPLKLGVDLSAENELGFWRFINEVGLGDLWSSEAGRFYGSVAQVPLDPDTQTPLIRLFEQANPERILTCPRREQIDRFLLEGMPFAAIAREMADRYEIHVDPDEVSFYARHFFAFSRRNVQELLELLAQEVAELEAQAQEVAKNEEIGLADRTLMQQKIRQQMNFYLQLRQALQSFYSEMSFRQGALEEITFVKMFTDVAQEGYRRFAAISKYQGMHVLDSMLKTVKMMQVAADKVTEFSDRERGAAIGDKGEQEEVARLITQRYEALRDEAESKATGGVRLALDDIEGLEEV